MDWDDFMPPLKASVRSIVGAATSTVDVNAAEDLVTAVLRILAHGLYPGTSVWTVLKLLERIGQRAESFPTPLHNRLKFAPKIASGIIHTMPSAPEYLKARAFVRCALNMGCLRATLELLSTVTACTKECCLGETHSSDHYLIRDLWKFLVTGEDTESAEDPAHYLLPTLLRPYVMSSTSLFCPDADNEVRFHQCMAAIAPVGGPELDVFLLGLPRPEGQFRFYLSLLNDNDADKYRSGAADDATVGLDGQKSLAVMRALEGMSPSAAATATLNDGDNDGDAKSDEGGGDNVDTKKKKVVIRKTKIVKKIIKKKKVKGEVNEDDNGEEAGGALDSVEAGTPTHAPQHPSVHDLQIADLLPVSTLQQTHQTGGVTGKTLALLNEQCRSLLEDVAAALAQQSTNFNTTTKIPPTQIEPMATKAALSCMKGASNARMSNRRALLRKLERLESELLAEYDAVV